MNSSALTMKAFLGIELLPLYLYVSTENSTKNREELRRRGHLIFSFSLSLFGGGGGEWEINKFVLTLNTF